MVLATNSFYLAIDLHMILVNTILFIYLYPDQIVGSSRILWFLKNINNSCFILIYWLSHKKSNAISQLHNNQSVYFTPVNKKQGLNTYITYSCENGLKCIKLWLFLTDLLTECPYGCGFLSCFSNQQHRYSFILSVWKYFVAGGHLPEW